MIANYHTHTYRCQHAFGKDEEYVEKAIAENLEILGFSDHVPSFPRQDGYVSYYKMRYDEVDGYFNSIESLKEKYADKIDIKCGYEAEYFKDRFKEEFEFMKQRRPEYLILGQHYVDYERKNGVRGNHSDRSPMPCLETDRIKPYADIMVEAISTDLFSCVAHPDVLTYTGPEQDYYLEQMSRIIEAAIKHGVPLEYNLLGQVLGRHYPRLDFWQLAADMKATVILGCDAHEPARVAVKEEIDEAKSRLSKLGIKLIDKMELRNPFK